MASSIFGESVDLYFSC